MKSLSPSAVFEGFLLRTGKLGVVLGFVWLRRGESKLLDFSGLEGLFFLLDLLLKLLVERVEVRDWIGLDDDFTFL